MGSNKKNGTDFETEFANLLSKYGFWVHKFAQRASGQPCDVIAVRKGRSFIFDCKDCELDCFTASRREENQKLSMSLWNKCGNGFGWFAFRMSNKTIYIMDNMRLSTLLRKKKVLNKDDIRYNSMRFDAWLMVIMNGLKRDESNNRKSDQNTESVPGSDGILQEESCFDEPGIR